MRSFDIALLIAVVSVPDSRVASAEDLKKYDDPEPDLKCYLCDGKLCGDPYDRLEAHEMLCASDSLLKNLSGVPDRSHEKTSVLLNQSKIYIGRDDMPEAYDFHFVCAKIVWTHNDAKEITRSCGFDGLKNSFCERLEKAFKYKLRCYSCGKHFCNTASSVHIGLGALAAAVALFRVINVRCIKIYFEPAGS